jgi:ferritin-like metal-binding protein YciE
MENMNQLRDLLKHEVEDLCSAEDQIIEALPKMIDKANSRSLKDALTDHLTVTEQQRERLDKVLELLNKNNNEEDDNNGGFLSGLFGGGGKKCKAMEGIIKEGESIMKEDMSPEVSDAAIIASAQKVEHYEIASYGTARAYAQELKLEMVEGLLKETLDEEYEADDLLTELAESRINVKATAKKRNGSQHTPEKSGRSSSRSGSRTKSNRSMAEASSKRGKTSSSSGGRTKKSSNGRSGKSSGKNAPSRKRSGGGRNK